MEKLRMNFSPNMQRSTRQMSVPKTIAFSYAMLYIPIGVATGISEGYIAFAGGLGLVFNNEKLKKHQWAGFLLAAIAVVALAIVTDK
jgi:multidrug transporter EmrE-like cation transporter